MQKKKKKSDRLGNNGFRLFDVLQNFPNFPSRVAKRLKT